MHPVLSDTLEFKLFRFILNTRKEILTSMEHGDFVENNYVRDDHTEYLIDFEFSRMLQPVGFDSVYHAFHQRKKIGKQQYVLINLLKVFLDFSFNEINDRNQRTSNYVSSIKRFLKFCYLYKREIQSALKFR